MEFGEFLLSGFNAHGLPIVECGATAHRRSEARASKQATSKKECNEIPSFAACTLTKNTNSPVDEAKVSRGPPPWTSVSVPCWFRAMHDGVLNPEHIMMCSFIIASPHGHGDDALPFPPPCRRVVVAERVCRRGCFVGRWSLA